MILSFIFRPGTRVMVNAKILMLVLISNCQHSVAQTPVTLNEAIGLALENNPAIQTASLEVQQQQHLLKTATAIPKTTVTATFGQYNSVVKDDNNFGVSQTIPFPTVWLKQSALGRAMVSRQEMNKQATENDILFQVSNVYVQLTFLEAKHALLLQQDSLYHNLMIAADRRHSTGESTLLEKISAETQWNEVKNRLHQNESGKLIYQSQLNILLGNSGDYTAATSLEQLEIDQQGQIEQNPQLHYHRQQVEVTARRKKVEAAYFLPEITVGFFSQTLIGFQTVDGQERYFGSGDRFQGIEVGLSLPLWFAPHTAKIKAAALENEVADQQYKAYHQQLAGRYEQALKEHAKTSASLQYYNTYALPNASDLIRQNDLAFRAGEIDYTTYLMNLKNAVTIREGYIGTLKDHLLNSITLNYLTGNILIREN